MRSSMILVGYVFESGSHILNVIGKFLEESSSSLDW